jgi:hypothetical protein
MELKDLSAPFAASNFSVFRGAIEAGGEVRGFVVPDGGALLAQGARQPDRGSEAARRRRARVGAPRGRRVQSPALKAAGEDTSAGARARRRRPATCS